MRDEDWTANGLAEELFAMFSPDAPANTDSSVSINAQNSMVAPIQITNYQDGAPIFNFGNGQQIGLSGGNWVTINQDGSTTRIC